MYLSNKVSNIVGHDNSLKVIKNLKKGKIGFFEKNLKTLLKQNLRRKKISFTNDFKKIEAQNYIICVGSEINNKNIVNKNLLNICKNRLLRESTNSGVVFAKKHDYKKL